MIEILKERKKKEKWDFEITFDDHRTYEWWCRRSKRRNWSNVDLIELILIISRQFSSWLNSPFNVWWFGAHKSEKRPDAYEYEEYDLYGEGGASINEGESAADWLHADSFELIAAMKLEIEMVIAETRPFAENIAVEMIAADTASFAMELAVEMIFVETRSFVENIIDEMIVANATSFDEVIFGSFSFWYEIWTETFEADATEAIEFDADATEVSEVDVEAFGVGETATGATKATGATGATSASETWNAQMQHHESACRKSPLTRFPPYVKVDLARLIDSWTRPRAVTAEADWAPIWELGHRPDRADDRRIDRGADRRADRGTDALEIRPRRTRLIDAVGHFKI